MKKVREAEKDRSWIRRLGHLRPWELASVNQEVGSIGPTQLRTVVSEIAEFVSQSYPNPLRPGDVEEVLLVASDICAAFAGIEGVKSQFHNAEHRSPAWLLLISALDGSTYDNLLAQIDFLSNSHTVPVVEKTAEIVRAYVSHNRIGQREVGDMISRVHAALAGDPASTSRQTVKSRPVPAVSVRKSVTAHYIISLEDGRKFRSLLQHLRTEYNMTPEEYREKWNLPKDYPMVAPKYSERIAFIKKQKGRQQSKTVRPRTAKG